MPGYPSFGGGGKASGPAGGDLSGTYPNPTINPTSTPRIKSLGVDTPAPATAGAVATKDSTLTNGGGTLQTGGSVKAGGTGVILKNDGLIIVTGATGGTDLAACARASTPAVTSGTAFTPSATTDSTVYVQTNATAAGTYTITMGPSTGAEHVIATAVKQVAGSDLVTTLHVPASWKVVVTVATATIKQVLVVTC